MSPVFEFTLYEATGFTPYILILMHVIMVTVS